ncbi:MAG TPA: cysteine dioxygenase family protein [Planctomycetota bacterium]|nr:cysteine dioxygenase family protein [Planctomycetota bacterium]
MSTIARITPAHLSLDDFVLEMAHIPSRELTMESLRDLVGHLDLRDELIQEHIRFVPDGYARNLVCRTPRFDMLVLCWKPGQVTTIHDHAGSLNVTRVFEGELTSRLFDEGDRPGPGRCLVRLKSEERLNKAPGAFSCVDHGEIHQLANTSDRELVTVHVYARPLKDITVYCPASGEIERVTLRYTLEDEFA